VLSDAGYCQAKSFDQIDNAEEKKERGITLIHLTLSMKLLIVTMRTLTVQVTRITWKTWLLELLKWMVLFLVAATDGPMPQTREHIF
jgi:elongation factor Tu